MKTVRQFINAVLEAGNWDIRDAFDDIIARDREHDDEKAELRAYATRLEAALTRAHACPTVRDDGECDGCYVSEALATWPTGTTERSDLHG